MMVGSVEDRKVFVSLYNIAYGVMTSTTESSVPHVIQLMNVVENPQNHFIHEFKHRDVVFAELIVQFQDVLIVRADTDNLKNRNILNPLDDGDLMGLPAIRPVIITRMTQAMQLSFNLLLLLCLAKFHKGGFFDFY